MKTTILVQWERVLAERVTLPQKNRWTRRAIAQFQYLSYEVFVYDTNMHRDSAA